MALIDSVLNMVNKKGKDPDAPKPPVGSRSEREAKIKDKAGWIITVIAALLAVNTYIASGNSGKVLSNTIKANDTWAFYQAKSIKQSIAEGQLEDAKDPKRRAELEAKIARYESDPAKGEGKKELMAKALKIEAERDEAKKHTLWLTFSTETSRPMPLKAVDQNLI